MNISPMPHLQSPSKRKLSLTAKLVEEVKFEKDDITRLTSNEFLAKHTGQADMNTMATLFSKLRCVDGIWQLMVYELLEEQGYSVKRIAYELTVSERTIKRLLNGETSKPSIRTSYKLFCIHAKLRKASYQQLKHKYQDASNDG